MHKRDMGVARGAGVDPQAQRMVTRETEVIRATGIDEGEPARGIRVPGVGRDLIERGLQLRRKRADVRGVNHRRQIYGPLTGWQWPTPAWCGRPELYQRPDLRNILRRRRIVDHQAEIGPAIDRKGGVFERDHSGFRVPNTFGACVRAATVMISPQRRESRALSAELSDQRFHVLRRPRPCPRDVRAERAYHEPGDALPIGLLDADVRIEEHETEQVT